MKELSRSANQQGTARHLSPPVRGNQKRSQGWEVWRSRTISHQNKKAAIRYRIAAFEMSSFLIAASN